MPKFVFAATLEEQEKQLQEHALVKRFAESRKENLKNPYHPRYHFVSPEDGLMNDPTGLSFWQGRWHGTQLTDPKKVAEVLLAGLSFILFSVNIVKGSARQRRLPPSFRQDSIENES